MKKERQYIARNRKALHDYFVEDRIEAGVALTGTEVRSLRDNSAQLRDCFIVIRHGEAWLNGVHIAPFINGSYFNVDPERRRKLLLHKKEILKLSAQASQQGYSLIPLSMYFNEAGRVKIELGVCRGKKNYDKRAAIKERDTKREIDRALKNKQRY